MTRRFLVGSAVAVGYLLAYGVLTTQTQNPGLGGPSRAEAAQRATSSLSDDVVTELRARIDKLEKELRATRRCGVFLGLASVHPEQGKVAEEELEVLRGLVETRLLTWRRVYALQAMGSRGGEASREISARHQFWLAFAQLAWAEQKDERALHHLEQAVRSANLMVAAFQAEYECGSVPVDSLLEAQAWAAQVTLTYYHAGGTLPGSKTKRSEPWTLPPGDLPKEIPASEPPRQTPSNALPEKTPPGDLPELPELPPLPQS